MLKYIGLGLALLFILCEAEGQGVKEMIKQVEELEKKLNTALRATGTSATDRLDEIERELKDKCNKPDIFDSIKEKYENLRENVSILHRQIMQDTETVEKALKDLKVNYNEDRAKITMNGFANFKNMADQLIATSFATLDKIDEMSKLVKNCSASRPGDKTVPQIGGTSKIPLAPLTLNMAAAFIAIKLAFH